MFTPINVPGAVSTLPFKVNNQSIARGRDTLPGGLVMHRPHPSTIAVSASRWARRALVLGLAAGALTARAARAQYTYKPVAVPGASWTWPFAVNNSGRVVGLYIDALGRYHGFVNEGSTYTTLDVPGAFGTEATGINNLGQIVGAYALTDIGNADEGSRGFIYDGSTFTYLDAPGYLFTIPRGINDLGQIVGSFGPPGGSNRPFLYSGGVFTDIPAPGDGDAHDINNAGLVTGIFHGQVCTRGPGDLCRAFTYKDGVFRRFGMVGTTDFELGGLNNAGVAIGGYQPAGGLFQAYLYQVAADGSSLTPISPFAVPGAAQIFGIDINDLGQVVGLYSTDPSARFGPGFSGFLASLLHPGDDQTVPILPTATVPGGASPSYLFQNAASGRWYDPADTWGYAFESLTSRFTEVGLPTGFDDPFAVYAGDGAGTLLGSFAGGSTVDLASLLGEGVHRFRITGIKPLTDGADPGAFPVQLFFDQATGNEFTMTPLGVPTATPEPATLALLATGLVLVGGAAARRCRHMA